MSMHSPRSSQTGAALGIALMILLIITILGVAAVRATQVELRLSQNAESRMAATQAAQSMVAFVSTAGNMPVNDNIGFHACARAGSVSLDIVPAQARPPPSASRASPHRCWRMAMPMCGANNRCSSRSTCCARWATS